MSVRRHLNVRRYVNVRRYMNVRQVTAFWLVLVHFGRAFHHDFSESDVCGHRMMVPDPGNIVNQFFHSAAPKNIPLDPPPFHHGSLQNILESVT